MHNQPAYETGTPYRHWDYSKPFVPSQADKFTVQTCPTPVEVGELELTKYEQDAIAKAEAKRARKALKR